MINKWGIYSFSETSFRKNGPQFVWVNGEERYLGDKKENLKERLIVDIHEDGRVKIHRFLPGKIVLRNL